MADLEYRKIDLSDTQLAYRTYSNDKIKRAYMLLNLLKSKFLSSLGLRLARHSVQLKLPTNKLIKNSFFKLFCGGESLQECESLIAQLGNNNIQTILDYATEGVEKDEDFDRVTSEVIDSIDFAALNPHIEFAVFKPTGVGRLSLMEKTDRRLELSESEKLEYERIYNRFEKICEHAVSKGVKILVDAEESWIQETVDNFCHKLMARFNKDNAVVFNTVQMYRRDRLEFLKRSYATASARGYKYGVKLVRGAYMEKEAERAKKDGYPNPIHSSKEATDQAYNMALRFIIDNIEGFAATISTHNETSVKLLIKWMAEESITKDDHRLSCIQLLGMRDNITYNLSHHGYRTAKYVPYGPLYELLPYLSRRADENSSVQGQVQREIRLLQTEMARRAKLKK